MKIIKNISVNIDGNKVSITGELDDVKFPAIVAQRHSVGHFPSTNPHKPRRCLATNHGFMVERYGADGFLFPMDEFAALAIQCDPKLADAPVVSLKKEGDDLSALVNTETDHKLQWQESLDGTTWSDIEPGADGKVKTKPGLHYKAIAINLTGTQSKSIKS